MSELEVRNKPRRTPATANIEIVPRITRFLFRLGLIEVDEFKVSVSRIRFSLSFSYSSSVKSPLSLSDANRSSSSPIGSISHCYTE